MRITSSLLVAVLTGALSSRAAAEPLRCDLTQLKPVPGLSATLGDSLLTVAWRGDGNHELRLRLTIVDGRPVIRDLSVRMNNLYAGSGLRPKYIIADIDTYQKGPEDDLYPNFPVNYLRLGKVPGPDEDWSPILSALRNGDFFVTTGEILIPSYKVEGTGDKRAIVADVEWTFPLSFVEVVWGDGKTIDRQIISATDLAAFGTKQFRIPFDAAGKAWVRFAVWDSAGNGAFVQPVWIR